MNREYEEKQQAVVQNLAGWKISINIYSVTCNAPTVLWVMCQFAELFIICSTYMHCTVILYFQKQYSINLK